MKKSAIFLILFFLIFSTSNFVVYGKEAEPTVSADSAVLIDGTTGTVLYSKNMNTSYPPASTTKIMTALLTFENTNLDDIVTVGKNPPNADGSKIYLFEGEQLTVRDLLYGMILASANDCAETLAEYIGHGSIDNFAKLMNKRAKELGCENTNFVNPSGLYNENHKTSAKDLALIMRALSDIPEYKTIATTSASKIAPTNKSEKERPLWNENKLIQKYSSYYYDGAIGGKTGYTIQSEHSYVAAATRNGQKLIVALVHDKNKTFFKDSIDLLNYGFKNFELKKMYSKGDEVEVYKEDNLTLPLVSASDFFYVKEKGDSTVPKYTINKVPLSDKSFKKDEEVLDASVVFNDKNIGTLKLASGVDHELNSVFNTNKENSIFHNKTYLIYGGIAALLISLITLIRIRIKIIRKKRRRNIFIK